MGRLLDKYAGHRREEPLRVLDVGSLDVNGTYRGLLSPAWSYLGIDIVEGPNVDVVGWDHLPEHASAFEIVFCGQTLEHDPFPLSTCTWIRQVLVPGGLAFVIAPFVFALHEPAPDLWRFTPAGLRLLLEPPAGSDGYSTPVLEAATNEHPEGVDSYAVARKEH